MNTFLFFLCIPILFICPILYPPIASFTATLFVKKRRIAYISLFLLSSAVIVNSLISATIVPVGDTVVYIKSFQDINNFNFSELDWDNQGFEPLYKIYEYFLSLFIGDNKNLFLFITALIFNTISTIAILKICVRLNQPKLAYIIFTVQYSLTPPAFGVSLFILRSSLSLAIMLLAISFYKQRPLIFYLLGTAAIFFHYSTMIIFATLIIHNYWHYFSTMFYKIVKKILFINLSKTLTLKLSLVILVIGLVIIAVSPSLITSSLQGFLISFGESGNAASAKAKSFLDIEAENFVDLKNPVVLTHIAISLLCFFKLRDNLLIKPNHNFSNPKLINFLEALRIIGRLLIIIIIFTASLNFLPYRMGFFNFLYFPIWLINIPFLSLSSNVKKQSKYLLLFALVCLLVYTLYWVPKRQGQEYFVLVLQGKPLNYNLVQVVEALL